MAYNFTMEGVAPNALSRYPVCDPHPRNAGPATHVFRPLSSPKVSFSSLEMLSISEILAVHTGHQESYRTSESMLSEYQLLLHYIQEGFPEQRSQLPDGRKFWGVRNKLSLDNGLIVYGCHLFIPARTVAIPPSSPAHVLAVCWFVLCNELLLQ